MRNEIDEETYRWSFKVFGLLGILLLVITIFLYFSPEPMHVMAYRFSSSTLLLLISVGIWLRLEYLKTFQEAIYKARRVPMWASIFVFAFVAFSRFF
jgi:hypothetical protein